MTKSSNRRPRPMPPSTRRQQRGVVLTYMIAVATLGSHRRDDVAQRMDAEGQFGLLPSSWLISISTSSIFLHAAAAMPTEDQTSSSSNNETDDDDDTTTTLHRPLNYYEQLNLEEPTTHRRKSGTLHNRKKRTAYRARILKDQIKKAYRKQAQKYHPDKASRYNMTTEEATSRFAEIAEAYQTLVDPAQRYEYDWELVEMEEEYEEERLIYEEEQRERKKQQRQQKQQQAQQQYNGDDASSLYDKIRNGASNFHDWKDTLNLDPWAVFEDFFFQDSTMGGGETTNNNNINPNDDFTSYQQQQAPPQDTNNPFNNNFQQQSHYQYHEPPSQKYNMPPRVSETTMYRGYDASFGADIYTVLRREEYIHDVNEQTGEYYYQILGQDFVSGMRVDPYTGFAMQEYYSAVTEPYFVEEGYSKKRESDFHHRGDGGSSSSNYAGTDDYQYDRVQHQQHNQNEQQQTKRSKTIKHRMSSSKLEEGESITPHGTYETTDPWISPNGKYQAILTPTCELQIFLRDTSDDTDQEENTVIWSSETYIPDIRAQGCYLTLNSVGRLVLSVDYGSGLESIGNTVLWNTPLPPVVPHWFQDEDSSTAKQQSATFRYYASLDDDGVIAVYRVRERVAGDGADDNSNGNEKDEIHEADATTSKVNNTPSYKLKIRPIIDKLGVMYNRITKSSAQQGQTKAALAWNQLRYSVSRIFSGRPWTASTITSDDQPNNSPSSRHECIYSTSPVGCLAPGRNAIHLSKKIGSSLKRSVQSMDSRLDHFLSVLTEPASDYDYEDDYSSYGYDFNNGYEYNHHPSSLNDDDDEDILDTLLRVTGAAGVQLGKAGMHAAQLGMKRGKKVAGKVVGKMKDGMGKTSIQWGERVAEKEEVDGFF